MRAVRRGVFINLTKRKMNAARLQAKFEGKTIYTKQQIVFFFFYEKF